MMIKAGKIVGRVTFAVALVSYAGALLIMLLNVADVLLTKLLARPIIGAYEITEILLLCTVMASFAYGQSKKAHINMAMIVRRLPRIVKFSVFGVMGLLSTAAAAAVGYAAALQAESAIIKGVETNVLLIPMYPFYCVESVAMFVLALALLYDAALSFAAIKSAECEEAVTSAWV
ncbi:MAG: TRAP transporter small permease [Clostridiales Family XIII bacterium]|jgi:TRAP-type C4-dicarboxylate transport system permease small subunit|nr:TRAP transporter small permease [Clostridiales Family XIII bacterium]